MKRTAISLFVILFCISSASAINFNILSQDEAKINESFVVSITAETSEIFDVKITITDNSSQKIISQIENGGWKNPYYYIKSAFPAKSEFSIKAINYSDKAVLCVRLRKEGTSSYSEVCRKILILKTLDEGQTAKENSTPAPKSDNNETSQSTDVKVSSGDDFVSSYNSDQSFQELIKDASSREKVLLNPASTQEKTFISAEEKVRLGISYAFAAICIVIVILISFRKI